MSGVFFGELFDQDERLGAPLRPSVQLGLEFPGDDDVFR